MLSEWRGLEYVLEVLRALHHHKADRFDSKQIAELLLKANKIEVNLSYLQKVLQRMTRIGLLQSTGGGYRLSKPINEIMVDNVLDYCAAMEQTSPVSGVVNHIKAAVSLTSIDEFYDFSET